MLVQVVYRLIHGTYEIFCDLFIYKQLMPVMTEVQKSEIAKCDIFKL